MSGEFSPVWPHTATNGATELTHSVSGPAGASGNAGLNLLRRTDPRVRFSLSPSATLTSVKLNSGLQFFVRIITMGADKTPLISKLVLMALLVNLGCLVVIIIQLKSRNDAQQVSSLTSESAPEQPSVAGLPEQANLPSFSTPRPMRKTVNPAPQQTGSADKRTISQTRTEAQDVAERPIELVTTLSHGVYVSQGPAHVAGVTRGLAEIYGFVYLDGTPPQEISIVTDGTTCGRLENKPLTTRHYVLSQDGRRLANVFVYIKEGLEKLKFPISTNQPLLDNTGCQFEPYVMGVQAGQTLRIKNSDPIMHNVHATSSINRGFNIGLVHKEEIAAKSFSLPEVFVRVKCDVHPWMFAYVGVLSHPFFAVTDFQGTFRLPPGLPPGKYLIAARHLKAGEAVVEVTIREDQETVIPFSLTVPAVALTSDR